MLEIVISSVIILLISFALLCVKVLLKKDGRFPDTHVGNNPALRKKGITCARTQDYEAGLQSNLIERIQKETYKK
jgi:hypothetical protein